MIKDVSVREVMRRTRVNLDAINSDYEQGRGVFEVTQLVNSFLSAFAHPWEEWGEELNRISIEDAMAQGWPEITGEDERDDVPEYLGHLVRLIRNGITHGNFRFIGVPDQDIEAIFLWNENRGWRTWGTTLDVETLKQLLDCIEALARDLPNRVPREPSRHYAERPPRERCACCGQALPVRPPTQTLRSESQGSTGKIGQIGMDWMP
jgi:hypothetical protein